MGHDHIQGRRDRSALFELDDLQCRADRLRIERRQTTEHGVGFPLLHHERGKRVRVEYGQICGFPGESLRGADLDEPRCEPVSAGGLGDRIDDLHAVEGDAELVGKLPDHAGIPE